MKNTEMRQKALAHDRFSESYEIPTWCTIPKNGGYRCTKAKPVPVRHFNLVRAPHFYADQASPGALRLDDLSQKQLKLVDGYRIAKQKSLVGITADAGQKLVLLLGFHPFCHHG